MATYGPDQFISSKGKSLIIRNLTQDDASVFIEFRKQIAHETTNTYQYVGQETLPEDQIARKLAAAVSDSIHLNLGVFDEKKLIGQLNFRPVIPGHPWVKHVGEFGMMILKENWGQGIGRRLLMIQEQHALECGVTRIEAAVRVKNERGTRLYQSAGFEIEGTRKAAALIQGEFQDEYYIAKRLGNMD